jgi:hypothetical protein
MVSTKEILCLLQQLRRDPNERLVITWLLDKRERPQDIADAVALMAHVADILNGEIDLFIGSMGAAQEGESSSPDQDNELEGAHQQLALPDLRGEDHSAQSPVSENLLCRISSRSTCTPLA